MTNLEKMMIFEEGKCLEAYKDTEGNWTIGIGHKMAPGDMRTITEAECQRLFKDDMKVAELGAKALGFWTMLSEPRRAVIISMVFQMGLDGVSRFIKMRAAIMREDWEAVFKEMLNSKWAKQTPGRAGRHAEQMRTGKWLDVYTKTP